MVIGETVVLCGIRKFQEQEENFASLSSALTEAGGWVN